MKRRLEGKTRTGKTKYIVLEVKGDELISKWGVIGSDKQQETTKKGTEKNIGKTNYISAEQNAIDLFERKIKRKIDEGYDDPDVIAKKEVVKEEEPKLEALQKYFSPCKPISKKPADSLTGDYLAERKYNGVNLIFTKVDDEGHIYTRRIDDITDNVKDLHEFKEVLLNLPNDSMILTELIYLNDIGEEIPTSIPGIVNKKTTKEKAHIRYEEISAVGQLRLIVFDVMFWKGMNVCNLPFVERREIFNLIDVFNVPEYVVFDKDVADKGAADGWEGFVLRKPDGVIQYTMNGKASRKGSWKYKFVTSDDFIVTGAEYGAGGRHAKIFARFGIAQYNTDGELIDCGYCGPGRLKQAELDDLYKARADGNGNYTVDPFLVIELEFRARQLDSPKLEFPIFVRIRDDKAAKECIISR